MKKIGIVLHPYGEKNPGGLGLSMLAIVKTFVEKYGEILDITIFLKNKIEKPLPISGKFKVEILNCKSIYFASPAKFKQNFDKLVFLTPSIPLFLWAKNAIVVIFDFAYLQLPVKSIKDFITSKILYFLHGVSLLKASKLFSISKDAAYVTEQFFKINSKNIETLYLGCGDLNGPEKKVDLPEKYFLFSGVMKERKNVKRIIEAFAIFSKKYPEINFVFTGKIGGHYFEDVLEIVKKNELEKKVHFKGFVELEELRYILRNAMAVVYPSLIEGFGMPILEAYSQKVPLITSNSGALAEIAGNCAVLVDPKSTESITVGMKFVMENPAQIAINVANGFERSKEFSWDKLARILFESF